MEKESSNLIEFYSGFSWAVPAAFKDALRNCHFELGDTFYDTPKAYCLRGETWGEVIQYVNHSIQVIFPTTCASPAYTSEDDDNIFITNWKTSIKLEYTNHRTGKIELINTTKGRLYNLLWKGDLSTLDVNSSKPRPPLMLSAASGYLKLAKDDNFIRNKFPNRTVFIMAFDPTNPVIFKKLTILKIILAKTKTIEHVSIQPQNICPFLKETLCPTISLECFIAQPNMLDKMYEDLKTSFYQGDNKKVSGFQANRHGLLLRT
jgi:hypothetical protein